jgi:hypothetical protein
MTSVAVNSIARRVKREVNMSDHKWGHCKNCKYFASPADVPLEEEEASCRHPDLSKYALAVFGACGCSGFDRRAGLPASVEQPAPLIQ